MGAERVGPAKGDRLIAVAKVGVVRPRRRWDHGRSQDIFMAKAMIVTTVR